jgi:hypothetical protein
MYLRELLRTEVAKVKEEMYYELDRLDDKLDRYVRRLDLRLSHVEDVMNTLTSVAMDAGTLDPRYGKSFSSPGFRRTSLTPIYPGFGMGGGVYDRGFGVRTHVDEINVLYLQNGIAIDGLAYKDSGPVDDPSPQSIMHEQQEFEDGKWVWDF